MAAQSSNNINGIESMIDIGLETRNFKDNHPFPNYREPKPIGFFSVSTQRYWEPTDEKLRYYKRPTKFPLDLNLSVNKAIKKPDNISEEEDFSHILKFIFHHHASIFSTNQNNQPDFITMRDVLRLIMCTPYEYKEDWCIHVTQFNNTCYMRVRELPKQLYKKQNQTEGEKVMCAWDHKFKQYCLWEKPFIEPDPRQPADECAGFSCVFRTRLGHLNLLFAAEMDGILSDELIELNYLEPNLENIRFVELKVRLGELNSQQFETYLRYDICNWWCQSFLVGINDLFIGLRNNDGLVENIEHLQMSFLPKMELQKFWTPSVCMNFLLNFLSSIKQIIGDKNCPHTVHEFYFNAKANRIYYKCWPSVTEHTFLPDWYLNLIRRNNYKG